MGTLLLVSLILTADDGRAVVVVTLDGVRPQEVFHGADRALMRTVENEAGLVDKYWADVGERRRRLLPFLWGTVARDGQLFGDVGSPMRVTNEAWCSYPGYNELFTGWADPRISGNGYGENPNVTVLEWLSKQPGFEGRVQAFATWDTFHRIFAVGRSGLDVRAGWSPPFRRERVRTEARDVLDGVFRTTTPLFGGNALDALTSAALREALRTDRPRALFLGLGETDEWMHAGRYDLALEAAHRADALVAELWHTLQALPEYRGRTTLIVTTDHGRGHGPENWKHHGADVPGSDQVWLGVIGPQVPALGVRAGSGLVTLSQVAATVGRAVELNWSAAEPRAAPPLPLQQRLAGTLSR